MRAPPGPAIVLALIGVGGLHIWMSLRSGVFWLLPTLRTVSRRESPAGFWAAIGAATLAVTILVGFMIFEATRHDGFYRP